MKFGYARISTQEQSLDLQLDALKAAGCERIFTDTASGAKTARPELDKLRAQLRPGDTLTVWRLDRLGRTTRHLIETVEELGALGIAFQSVTEAIDTTSPNGRMIFTIFAALAQFERELLIERTRAGMAAARARGRVGGRKHKLSDEQLRMAQALRNDPSQSIASICKTLNISRSTFYRYTQEPQKEG